MNKEEFESKVERQMLHSGDFVGSLNLELSFSKTDHAKKRQDRHSSKITDEEIENTIDEVDDIIKEKVLTNELESGDELVIRDQVYNLNLVVKLEKISSSSYRLILETVMLSRDFNPNPDQGVIDIYNS